MLILKTSARLVRPTTPIALRSRSFTSSSFTAAEKHSVSCSPSFLKDATLVNQEDIRKFRERRKQRVKDAFKHKDAYDCGLFVRGCRAMEEAEFREQWSAAFEIIDQQQHLALTSLGPWVRLFARANENCMMCTHLLTFEGKVHWHQTCYLHSRVRRRG